MSQKELFDRGPRWPSKGADRYPTDLYSGRPPAVDVDTSRDAITRETATRKAAVVLELLSRAGARGSTSDEAEVELGWPHQTVSARLRELELRGLARKTDNMRRTRQGRPARVYVLEAGA